MKLFVKRLNWKFIIALLALVALESSCTVQKRLHRKGWHVDWRLAQKSQNEVNSDSNNKESHKENATNQRRRFSEDLESSESSESNENKKSIEAVQEETANDEIPENNLRTDQHPISVERNAKKEIKALTPSNPRIPNEPMSPPKPPITAYIFLFIGAILTGGGLILILIFAIINSTLIGLPSSFMVMVLVGIAFLILAYRSAVNAEQKEKQWTPPVKEQPKEEKKEREPLKRGDKIFLAIIGALLAVISVALIVY